MGQVFEERGSLKCLVCAARVGQLVPFCEWCGAKHAFAGGALVLTGAICQECGYQAAVPFSRCPQCRAQRRILCPACGTELAVRQVCDRCGLHFLFFDKVRREHNRSIRHQRVMRMSTAVRKLVFIVFVLAIGLPMCAGHETRWFALGLILSLAGTIAFGTGALKFSIPRRRKGLSRDLVCVLESYDSAEAMAARAWLRLSGIEAQAVPVADPGIAGAAPGGMWRIMVSRTSLAKAAGCLADHGFELAGGMPRPGTQAQRWNLRLVHSATRRTEPLGEKPNHDRT